MIRTQKNNEEILNLLNVKLQRDYSKLMRGVPKKDFTDGQEQKLDYLTWGNDKNNLVVGGSLVVPLVPFALGVGKALIGLITLAPSMTQNVPEEAVSFFESAKEFSVNSIGSGFNSISGSIPLFALPAAVSAISLSTKVYRNFVDKKKNKAYFTNEMIKLIDDVIEQKDDPSLEFAKKFFSRVDLSLNDPKLNVEILKYLTYHRVVLEMYQDGKVNEQEVENAYDRMILFFKVAKRKDGVSQNFKNSRFLNILIQKNDEKNEIIEQTEDYRKK